MLPIIREKLSLINFTDKNSTARIRYIVVHYCGATGSAEANVNYYYDAYRGASAHYFVGHSGECWRSVADGDIAWHCGTKGAYVHPDCRNSNSIGIEMCVRNQRGGKLNAVSADAGWYFEPETISATIALISSLMDQYAVPMDHILRHYDVTGKWCPAPYVNGQLRWEDFLAQLRAYRNRQAAPILPAVSSPFAAEAWSRAFAKGLFDGTNPTAPLTREQAAVLLDRLGLLR